MTVVSMVYLGEACWEEEFYFLDCVTVIVTRRFARSSSSNQEEGLRQDRTDIYTYVKKCIKYRHIKIIGCKKKCCHWKKIKFCAKRRTIKKCCSWKKKTFCKKHRHYKKCIKRSKGRRVCKKHKWVGGRKICIKHYKKRVCYKKRRVDELVS